MEGPVEILIVEDDPRDAELVLRALKNHGVAEGLHHVRDGAEALEFLFGTTGDRPGNRPKVILLDLKLPRIAGLEVLRRVRSDAWTRFIPVVVLTSSAEDRDVVESYRLGANSYVVKPVDSDKFLEAVAEVGLYWLQLNRPSAAGR